MGIINVNITLSAGPKMLIGYFAKSRIWLDRESTKKELIIQKHADAARFNIAITNREADITATINNNMDNTCTGMDNFIHA